MLKTNPLKVVVVAALVILLLLTVSMDITAEDVTVRTISADDVQTVDTDDIRPIRAEESEVSATNKQDQVSTKLLDDARYSWARDDIEELASQGAVIGYPDGTFKPNQAISRAEFAAMLCRALDLEKADDAPDMPYTDLADHWAAEYVDALYSHELLSVMDGETFDPDAEVTRSEIVSTLMGIIDIQERFGNPLDNVDASFIDLTSGDSLFAEVEAAERLGSSPFILEWHSSPIGLLQERKQLRWSTD